MQRAFAEKEEVKKRLTGNDYHGWENIQNGKVS